MTLTLSHFLVLGALLFAISVVGIFLNRKNVIILLMAIELMLLAVNLNFIAFSYYLGDAAGPSAWQSWWCCSATSRRSTSMTSTHSRDRRGG